MKNKNEMFFWSFLITISLIFALYGLNYKFGKPYKVIAEKPEKAVDIGTIQVPDMNVIDINNEKKYINETNLIIFPDSEIENKRNQKVFVPGFKLYTKVHNSGKNWHEYHRIIFELLYEQNSMKKIIKQECIDEKLLKFMNLKKGNWVADIGAGPGNYIHEFRRLVGQKGKVYSTDIDPNSKEYIDWYNKCIQSGTFVKLGFKDCHEKLPENLVTQINPYNDPELPINKFDWIFMNMVHVWANTKYENIMRTFADNTKKSMKKNGKIILTEIIYPKEIYPEAHRIHISTIEDYEIRFKKLGFKIEHIEIDSNGSRLIAILKK